MNTEGNSGARQLILVVEGTAALGAYWSQLRSEYIDKLVRSFSGNELGSQKSSGPNIEMALVVFYTHGPHSAGLVQRSPWTADFKLFLKWLSEITFCAGGFGEVAIAEGLADALMMLAPSQALTQMAQGLDRQKYCLLVAASNPYPIATPVPRPPCHTSCQQDQWLADAETVAKAYAQCFVSLSVIVPKQLPKLRSVFNAGQHNPSAIDVVLKNIKHSHSLVLLSDSLMDACSAQSRSGETSANASENMIETDSTSAAVHSVPLQPQATTVRHSSGHAVDRVMIGYPHAPNRELLSGTVKMELPTSIYLTSASGLPHMNSSSLLHGTSQETESNIDAEHGHDNKSLVCNTSQPLHTVTASTTNLRLSNDLSHSRLGSSDMPGASTSHQTGNALVSMQAYNLLANIMSLAPIPTPQDVQVTGHSGMTSACSSVGLVGIGQVAPTVSQNSLSKMHYPKLATRSQTDQSGGNIFQNALAGMGPVRISSGAGTKIPKPSLNQAVHLGNLQGVGMGNNSTGNLQLPSASSASQQPATAQAVYTKVWEGMLEAIKQSKPVHICKMEAYRNITLPETLAADWPTSMQVLKVISQEYIKKKYQGKEEYLIFRPMSPHHFLAQLCEMNLAAVIQLPNQILLLSSSDRRGLMIGIIVPIDTLVLKPQPPNHLQQEQQHEQQQQQWWRQQQRQWQQQSQMLQQPLEQQQLQQVLHQLQERQRQQGQDWEQQRQRISSYIGQKISRSQAPNQTRLHFISQGQFQRHGPASMQGGGAQQQQQLQKRQGIPSAIEQQFAQSEALSQIRPQIISQGRFQGHGPASMAGAGAQQQQQKQQPQVNPSANLQPFLQSQPTNQSRPEFISQGQFQGQSSASMQGASAQQPQQQQQPEEIPSAHSQPPNQIWPQYISQDQFQPHDPESKPGAGA